jgi:hypothetical protein
VRVIALEQRAPPVADAPRGRLRRPFQWSMRMPTMVAARVRARARARARVRVRLGLG